MARRTDAADEFAAVGDELAPDAPADLRALIEARALLLLAQRAYHRQQRRRAAAFEAFEAARLALEGELETEARLSDQTLAAVRLASQAQALYARRVAEEDRRAFMANRPPPARWVPPDERGDAWEPPPDEEDPY